jgi:hypothetical protein
VTQGRLPLFRVVFVDWHGVLCSTPFWSSVLDGRNTRLRRALERRLDEVFGGELASTWMRGDTSVDRIVSPLVRALGANCRGDFLQRRIIDDCLSMQVDVGLAIGLRALVQRALVVLATDNTGDFEVAFRRAQRRKAFAESPATLRELAPWLDDILCSSATRVFKAEEPQTFFGPWLETNGLTFDDALLIDDRPDNCRAFERCGGSAVLWDADRARRRDALHIIDGFVSSLGRVPAAPRVTALQ